MLFPLTLLFQEKSWKLLSTHLNGRLRFAKKTTYESTCRVSGEKKNSNSITTAGNIWNMFLMSKKDLSASLESTALTFKIDEIQADSTFGCISESFYFDQLAVITSHLMLIKHINAEFDLLEISMKRKIFIPMRKCIPTFIWEPI